MVTRELRRRALLARALPLLVPPALAGCAAAIEAARTEPPVQSGAARAVPVPAGAAFTPWRIVNGGFLAPPVPGIGLPPRPASGMFVRFLSPGAVALRGQDLLVADVGAARLWRADPWTNSITGIAGAPVYPETSIALGPDLAAWVLDPRSRQVLRFARDGRLAQTWRVPLTQALPSALALADGGATLLLADGAGAQWSEQRTASGIVTSVAPWREGGLRVSGVDGIALARDGSVFVLDRAAGAVHRAQRDGRVLETFGQGALKRPTAIAADRFDRVFVHDAHDNAIHCLRSGQPCGRFTAAELGVQRIAGLAVDERWLAVADAGTAQVVIVQLAAEAPAP